MQLKLPGINQGVGKPATTTPIAKKEHLLKQDFIVEITGQLDGYLKKDIGLAVDIILESMALALIEGQRVEIRGFGSFEARQRKAKVSRNPKTDKVMNIPPRKTLHFTMSKSVKDPLIKK